jgi:branched-chain amino acid transport system substrate-binding protein
MLSDDHSHRQGRRKGEAKMTQAAKAVSAAAAIVLMAAMASAAHADNTQGITATTIKIGNLGPFSGESAVFNPLNYGPEAYLRYINDHGGINGRKFETVFADDACNEAKGVAAAKKLIYEDKVFMIIGHPCSGVAMAIKPMVDKEGVPWVGLSANPKITNPVTPSMFHVGYTGIASGEAMATFAMSQPGIKKVALVQHSNDWAHGYCEPASAIIKKNGGEIVVDAALERGSTDATAQALQVKASGAQAVMGCLYQPELVILLRDLGKFGVKVPVLGALGADFEQTVAQVNDLEAVKQIFFQPYQFKAPLGQGPLKEFHDMFLKYLTKDELPKSGEPTNFYYFGVPAAIVTVEAMRRAGPDLTREKWIAAMESLKDWDTGVFADKENISHDNHDGVHLMYAVGLNAEGKETVYKSWGVPAE